MSLLRIFASLALLAGLLPLAACEERYEQNDLELITAYRAKAMCTCMFVQHMSEDYCAAYSLQSPPVATFTIDLDRRVVESQAILMWGARAHFVSERFGCVLD